MHLEHLELSDFRCYTRALLPLGPGVRVLVGGNAQGKTNVLEAVHYLATGASHRVSSDVPLVRAGCDAAVIRARARVATSGPAGAVEGGRPLSVELELRPGARNRARVNGQPQTRTRDALGVVRSVLFAPEDLELVRGDPASRRRFLDELLTQRRPAYHGARQEYDRVLRQRNALLKGARAGGRTPDTTLATWTDSLATVGATVLAARIAAVHALSGPALQAYRQLSDRTDATAAGDPVTLAYELSTGRRIDGDPDCGVPDPRALADELREGLDRVAPQERERGVSLAGPHRDELFLGVGALPAKGYASHGESWSLALALRLASREVLREIGEEPIVLLDDVFAELDTARRERLANRCATFEQVIVTAAVEADVPLQGPRYRVRRCQVAADAEVAGAHYPPAS